MLLCLNIPSIDRKVPKDTPGLVHYKERCC